MANISGSCKMLSWWTLLFVVTLLGAVRAQQQDPFTINGGSCMAMAGKDCVAVAVDRRFGSGPQLISTDAKRVLKVHQQLLCGFTGLGSDIQTLMQEIIHRVTTKTISEQKPILPAALASMISAMLYSKRASPYYTEPIIAGLGPGGKPFLCTMDVIGAPMYTDDFVVGGTSATSLYGTCEALFRKDMEAEELFQTAAKCLLAALERDCLSGYGAVIHLLTPQGLETRELDVRID